MDKNLGATVAGTTSWSYGSYYQRGNNYGFANSGTVTPNSTALVSGATRPYSGSTWIYGSNVSNNNYDRTIPRNDNLRWGNTSDGATTIPTNDTERQWPCPAGYHVPSQGEWNQLLIARASINSISLSNNSGYKYFSDSTKAPQFRNDFLLPLAGSRDYGSAATVYNQGSYGYYWSSSPNSAYARILFMDSSSVYALSYTNRADGFSVRCFKN